MSETTNYSTIIVDVGSGTIKAGFSGEDGPRSVFSSIVGTPKMPGLLVGMEQRERYIGDDAISKLEIMHFNSPIQKGEIKDWDKFENLMQYILYNELKVVPEEISILITESPLNPKQNRAKLAETLFETFNIEKIYIANTAMLGLYSYGKTSGIVLDSGFGITSCVPVFEGYPIPHASHKIQFAGENLSEILLNMISGNIPNVYKGLRGRLLADRIKESKGYVAINCEEEEKHYLNDGEQTFTLPDGNTVNLGTELFKHSESLFRPFTNLGTNTVSNSNTNNIAISQLLINSLNKCDKDILNDIQENICLTGGTTLLEGFTDRLKNEIMQSISASSFNLVHSNERQFSNWIGGSIISSLNNFSYMWVSKGEYDEIGDALEAVESKCF